MPKHSVAPAEGTPPAKLVTLVTVHAKRDKVEGYLNAVSKIPEALAKTGSDTSYDMRTTMTYRENLSYMPSSPTSD